MIKKVSFHVSPGKYSTFSCIRSPLCLFLSGFLTFLILSYLSCSFNGKLMVDFQIYRIFGEQIR